MAEDYDAPLPWTGRIDAPLVPFRCHVRPEWIDAFGHVNVAHYLTICDHANWAFWNWINHPEGAMDARGGHEYVIVENHVRYIDELALGIPIHVETQLLGFDDKRYVLFHRVFKSEGDALAATNEVKCLGFDLSGRRPESWRSFVAERLELVRDAHHALGMPDAAGKGIALKRK